MADEMNQKENIHNLMNQEAKERMELLQIASEDMERFFTEKEMTKVVADHVNMRICKQALTDAEKEMIQKLEKEKEYLAYYLIQDEGLWPDGSSFPRYTVLFVDTYKDEYRQVKKFIQTSEVVPAYIINQEEPDYSESTEIAFQNVSGLIINIS